MNKVNNLFHIYFKLQRQYKIQIRFCQQETSELQQKKNSSFKENWIPIYYFPYIRLARILNRLKLYQTVFAGAAVPVTLGMHYYSALDLSVVNFTTGCSVFACCTLYPITWCFRRLVGVIFVSQDDKFVKISHLTFWGNKKDIIVPSENIIPLTDCEYNPNDAFVKLQRQDVVDVLYFSLRYGNILDESKFQSLFGDLDILGFSNYKKNK